MSTRRDAERMRAQLPEPPEGLTAAGIGLWLSSIAIKAALDRGHEPDDLRAMLMVLLANVATKEVASDGPLLAEFADYLQRARAGRFDH